MDLMDLVAKLTMDSSDYESGLSKVQKGAKAAFKAVGAAIAAGSAAIVGFGASSVKVGMDFDKSMSQVAATLGLSMEEMETQVGKTDTAYGEFEGTLREFAQFMGANTAFSATQAADALNYMALAGYNTQESMNMLPNVLNLAAAGAMDLATASDMVTDVQTAFGLKMEEMPQLVDEMAKAASTGNTSVQQLGEAFLVVGGLAQELNGGFVTLADGTEAPVSGIQEMEIALTAMANAGIKGSEAGTHMRNMIMKLSSPTKEGVETMEALGVKVFDASGNMRSLADIMGDLNGALGNVTQEQKIQAISDLFNARDLASAEALLNAINQDWNEIGESILDADDAAQKMANTQLDNLAGDVTIFKSALEGAQIAISDVLTPSLRKFVKYGTEGISELTTAFKKDGLSGALDALDGIINQGIELIFSVLPTVTTAGLKLVEALISGVLNNLPKLIDAAIQIITTLVNDIDENLPKILDAAVEIIFALADGLINALPTLIPSIIEIILKIVEKLTDPDTISQLIDAGFKIIGALGVGLINALPTLIENVPKIIKNLVKNIINYAPDLMKGGAELMLMLGKGFLDKFEDIKKSMHGIVDKIKGIFDFDWTFPKPKLPHFKVDWRDLGIISIPNVSIEWYKKAYDNPYMFTKPTVMGFGDGVGGEMVYGHQSLLNDIKTAMRDTMGNEQPVTIIVQSVLDGKVIGETATKWQRQQARAFG